MSGATARAGRADALGAGAPVVEVRSFCCRFPDGSLALEDVDLTVKPGEIVAVMGRSGAGKSTLLRCLSRVVPVFDTASLQGEIRLFGESVAGTAPASLAGRVGVVFQDFEAQLFSTNVALEVAFGLDQLGVAPEIMRRRVAGALSLVGLEGFGDRDPATLSGGEKQRLALAAIWALEPALVLLDEPTTDIDPLGKRAVFDMLRAFRSAGAAVVVVEHEPEAAAIADSLLLLADGRVRACGPSSTLLRDLDLLRECGVRPRDLDVVAAAVGLAATPASSEEAASILHQRGWRASASIDASRSDADSRPAPHPRDAAPHIEVEDAHYEYEGTRALDGVSLSIARGEFVAIVGQNGSGKTTLAKLLTGILAPASGAVRVEGEDTRARGIAGAARCIGFVFQDPDQQLFCDSVYDEVAFGPRELGLAPAAIEARVERCLERTGLCDKRAFDPFLLSKGERQRLALAAVLALEPRALLLDEPTTGLDDPEQRALLDLLAQLNRAGTTVIAITHAPWLVAEHVERTVLMGSGKVLFDGPVRDLFASPQMLRAAAFEVPPAYDLAARMGLRVRSARDLVRGLERSEERS